MPTYDYKCDECGTVEASHSIKAPALTECPQCGRACTRLISRESGGFRLVRGPSGGWGNDGYSLKPHERLNEHLLGRKLTKPAG